MLLPVVAVDIAPADAPPAMAEALIAACSSALRRGSCRPISGVASDESRVATARVVWDEADAAVRVAVKVQQTSDPTVMSRSLSFASGDARSERWRAAGLIVASLVGEFEAQYGSDPRDERATEPSPAPLPPNAERLAWFGLAATVAPGVSPGATRVGGRIEGGFALAPPIYGLAAFDYSFGAGGSLGLDTRWLTLRTGVLYSEQALSNDLALGLSAEILAQHIAASAVAPTGTESGAEWDPGVAVGLRAVWLQSSAWSFSTGLDLWRLRRGTTIVLRDEEVARSSAWGGSFWIGMQWDPFAREKS